MQSAFHAEGLTPPSVCECVRERGECGNAVKRSEWPPVREARYECSPLTVADRAPFDSESTLVTCLVLVMIRVSAWSLSPGGTSVSGLRWPRGKASPARLRSCTTQPVCVSTTLSNRIFRANEERVGPLTRKGRGACRLLINLIHQEGAGDGSATGGGLN